MSFSHSSRHRPVWRCVGVGVLLTVFLLTCQPHSLAAAPTGDGPLLAPATPTCVILANFVGETMGNRTRMIQVGCVFVAIGIFVLTRTYR